MAERLDVREQHPKLTMLDVQRVREPRSGTQQILRRHVVISGTGRAGTTFLVELLTRLGLETGFTTSELASHTDPRARAGLEHELTDAACPYVVKSPHFCDHAEEVLADPAISIDHVFIPMRDLYAAAESRRFVQRCVSRERSLLDRLWRHVRRKDGVPGGFFGRTRANEQERLLSSRLYNLFLALSDFQVPVTLLRFPKLVQNGRYLFEKLRPVLPDVEFEEFRLAFQQAARPDLVHDFRRNKSK